MATRKTGGTEYRFKIDAFSPETIPMARLAEYMKELAAVLGTEASVHFDRLEAGSTILVHKIEKEAIPKVRDRARSVMRHDAPAEAQRAYRSINKLLKEDNAVGSLKEPKGVLLHFPGREDKVEKYPPIRQHGTFDGKLVAVGGGTDVHVRLESEGTVVAGFTTSDRRLGKELAKHFDDVVRLVGWASWSRDADGKWTMTGFRIESFKSLRSASLSEALGELRALPVQFDDGAYQELDAVRSGPGDQKNGRH
ncbi:hypothetical protein [Mesorhizobium kowhaii]|uniref:Uncharacterized protein n=1 Tax=Mesorhizobium kowhaii TaxID=1300272 RepID=A0A2W7BYQ6_9HYPH|nr:hypothetical protein [Mesorhizobium kowhaii]PZV35970.1 hypothetical protein B5V02_22305 [Mesorhizobium kowhaii]